MKIEKGFIILNGRKRRNQFVHYGASEYRQDKFKPVKNSPFLAKPRTGGLWVSPIDSKFGWKHWCYREELQEWLKTSCFKLSLKLTARICIIDNYDDLICLPFQPKNEHKIQANFDFEEVAQSYDAIWLTYEGMKKTAFTHPIHTYGWDCETLLVLNKYCFEIVL